MKTKKLLKKILNSQSDYNAVLYNEMQILRSEINKENTSKRIDHIVSKVGKIEESLTQHRKIMSANIIDIGDTLKQHAEVSNEMATVANKNTKMFSDNLERDLKLIYSAIISFKS